MSDPHTYMAEVDPRVASAIAFLLVNAFDADIDRRTLVEPHGGGVCLIVSRFERQVPEQCFAFVDLFDPNLMIGNMHHSTCPYAAWIIDAAETSNFGDSLGNLPACPVFSKVGHVDTKPLPIHVPDNWEHSRLLRPGIGPESWN